MRLFGRPELWERVAITSELSAIGPGGGGTSCCSETDPLEPPAIDPTFDGAEISENSREGPFLFGDEESKGRVKVSMVGIGRGESSRMRIRWP